MGQKAIPDVGNSARKKAQRKNHSMTEKQIRARARRAGGLNHVTEAEVKVLMRKPLKDWTLQELAKGRPADKNGRFTGASPFWVTREMHEKAMEMFKAHVRTDMNSHTVRALEVIREVMDNDEVDDKGKPLVPAGTKVDVAKFLIEHLMGKPTQPIQTDISIKLQGILGASLVMPDFSQPAIEGQPPSYIPASSHRDIEDAEIVEEDEDELEL